MKTQQDHPVRILALENLRAMCGHASGMCHRYWIEKVTRSRVWVGYSNPNEYAAESPMFAILPVYPSPWPEDQDNPRVVLDTMRTVSDTWDGEGWQAFNALWDQYACRDMEGSWKVVPFDTVQLFGKDYVEAQHKAYASH